MLCPLGPDQKVASVKGQQESAASVISPVPWASHCSAAGSRAQVESLGSEGLGTYLGLHCDLVLSQGMEDGPSPSPGQQGWRPHLFQTVLSWRLNQVGPSHPLPSIT